MSTRVGPGDPHGSLPVSNHPTRLSRNWTLTTGYLQELVFLSLFHQREVCWFCLCFCVAVERRNKTREC